jgi:hypothetical protein
MAGAPALSSIELGPRSWQAPLVTETSVPCHGHNLATAKVAGDQYLAGGSS